MAKLEESGRSLKEWGKLSHVSDCARREVVLALNHVAYQRVSLCSHGRESHRSTSLSTGKAVWGGWCLRVGRVPASPPCQER